PSKKGEAPTTTTWNSREGERRRRRDSGSLQVSQRDRRRARGRTRRPSRSAGAQPRAGRRSGGPSTGPRNGRRAGARRQLTVLFGQSAPGDAGAAHDGVLAVVEADPGLALAVIVGRPDDERRLAAADRYALGALRSRATPDAHERVLLALAADCRLVGMARQDARLV